MPGGDAVGACRESEVRHQIDRLGALVGVAYDVQGNVADRLSGITKPMGKTENEAKEAPLECIVPLAAELRDIADKLDQVTSNYARLIQSIEL